MAAAELLAKFHTVGFPVFVAAVGLDPANIVFARAIRATGLIPRDATWIGSAITVFKAQLAAIFIPLLDAAILIFVANKIFARAIVATLGVGLETARGRCGIATG